METVVAKVTEVQTAAGMAVTKVTAAVPGTAARIMAIAAAGMETAKSASA
jgi:hypothetical protein